MKHIYHIQKYRLEDKKDSNAYKYYYGFANDKIKYEKFAKKMKSYKIIHMLKYK